MTTAHESRDHAIAAAIQATDTDQLTNAIEAQKPMVLNTLRLRGALGDVDEVMSDIADQVMRSLPRFHKNGNVGLTQWATGVAKNVLKEHQRQYGRAHAMNVPFEEAFAHSVVTMDPLHEDEDILPKLLAAVRDHVTSQPGGVEEWHRLVTMATKPERGRAARDTIREHMATLSGLPASLFGNEQDLTPEPATAAPVAPVDTKPIMLNGHYRIHCTACGLLPETHDTITTAITAARTHAH